MLTRSISVFILILLISACGEKKNVSRSDQSEIVAVQGTSQTKSADDSIKVDEYPIPVKTVNPKYPLEALQAGLKGKVWLKILVGSDGIVHDVRVMNPKDSLTVFERAAAEAAKQWTFVPAKYNGKPIDLWAAIPFVFRLNDDSLRKK